MQGVVNKARFALGWTAGLARRLGLDWIVVVSVGIVSLTFLLGCSIRQSTSRGGLADWASSAKRA